MPKAPTKYKTCSVLMCLYKNDNPSFLRDALLSITTQQIVQPSEIVISVDGPIPDDLKEVLEQHKKNFKNTIVVQSKKNKGVGHASNCGLKHCTNELVAKMDADDIAKPDRLKLQLEAFQKDDSLVLVGGQIEEFSGSLDNIVGKRIVPTTRESILKFARRRAPFNNPTVMYKKSVVLELGGYPDYNRGEDYLLSAKILAAGHNVVNLDSVLLSYRANDDAFRRRKTWRHTKENILVQNEIRKLGISSFWDFLSVSIIRLFLFILPRPVTRLFYGFLR